MSELIPRTVLLTAEDWAEFDRGCELCPIECGHDPCDFPEEVVLHAAYTARPAEPRTVELDGDTWTEDEDGMWSTDVRSVGPCGHVTTASQDSPLAAALVRIWRFEHPEEADDE